MSYPRCQDSARKKEATKHGNINPLSILRGGQQPSGLGGQWSLLRSLRGKNRRKSTPGVGGAGLAQKAIGVGSGLEAKDKSCVVRWGYWRRWRELAARVFAWVVLGPFLSCRFYRRWRLPFGGRWPGWRERGGGVDVEFFPPDTRNLTQRSLRSERMEKGGFLIGEEIAHTKAAKDAKGGGRESAIFNVGFFPAVAGHAHAWILD